MKIGLPFLTQLQGSPEADALTGGGEGRDPEESRSLGGWMAQTIRQLVSQISVGYHTQHNDDDTHKTITATGSVAERSRTTAMGVWITAPYVSTYFTAPTGSTWTVTRGQLISYQYALVGSTCTLSFYVESSTIGSAAAAALYIRIPGNFTASRRIANQFAYDDNGTRGTGIAQVYPSSTATDTGVTVALRKDMRGATTFSVSSGLSVFGEITFEIVASDTSAQDTSFVASGGTISTAADKTIHTFASSGTFVVMQGGTTITYLVVGGGAGGGSGTGGGGGGGAVKTGTQVITEGSYTVTVGAGGAKGTGYPGGTDGSDGGQSQFVGAATVTSAGGGGGGTNAQVGHNGASGGGGGSTASGGTATDGGGNGGNSTVGAGGGGGAAPAAGTAGGAADGGAGGAGLASSISGVATNYGGGGGGGDFAGTAGARGDDSAGYGQGAGSVNAPSNRGGGGGGSSDNADGGGGTGGSGIVIISYTTP